jgi:hypothetical protein
MSIFGLYFDFVRDPYHDTAALLLCIDRKGDDGDCLEFPKAATHTFVVVAFVAVARIIYEDPIHDVYGEKAQGTE